MFEDYAMSEDYETSIGEKIMLTVCFVVALALMVDAVYMMSVPMRWSFAQYFCETVMFVILICNVENFKNPNGIRDDE